MKNTKGQITLSETTHLLRWQSLKSNAESLTLNLALLLSSLVWFHSKHLESCLESRYKIDIRCGPVSSSLSCPHRPHDKQKPEHGLLTGTTLLTTY